MFVKKNKATTEKKENKAKAHEAQKEMRKDIEEFVKKCNVFELQQMYQRMKDLKK